MVVLVAPESENGHFLDQSPAVSPRPQCRVGRVRGSSGKSPGTIDVNDSNHGVLASHAVTTSEIGWYPAYNFWDVSMTFTSYSDSILEFRVWFNNVGASDLECRKVTVN